MRRFMVAMVCCLVIGAVRAETTVVLPALQGVVSSKKPTDDTVPYTIHYLHECFRGLSGVRVMDAQRTLALWETVMRGQPADADPRALISDRVPVDAVIGIDRLPGQMRLRVYLADGVQEFFYATPPKDRQALAATVGGDIATALRLPPESRKQLTTKRFADARLYEGYHQSLLLGGAYLTHMGEIRLTKLQHLRRDYPTNLAICRRVLEEAISLASWPKVKDYEKGFARTVASVALPVVLASEDEADLAVAAAYVRLYQESFTGMVEQAGRIVGGEISMDGLGEDDLLGDAGAADEDPQKGQRRLGMLYVIAALGSDALPRIRQDLEADDHAVGLLYAGLGEIANPELPPERLRALSRDPNPRVAVAAGLRLAVAGEDVAYLLPVARQSDTRAGRTLLAQIGDVADCRPLTLDPDSDIRRHAWVSLLRQQAVNADMYLALISDVDGATVAAVSRFPAPEPTDAIRDRLMLLANEPWPEVSEPARDALAPWRPDEPAARATFDLAVEHPFLRSRVLDRIAAGPDPVPALAAACDNLDAMTRGNALLLLHAADPAAARPRRLAMIHDTSLWVRLQAASILQKEDATDPALRPALATETDPVVAYHLRRVLDDAPPPLPPARPVAGVRHTWSYQIGRDAANSPFTAYYQGSLAVNDRWREAYAAGKTVLARHTPIDNPGMIATDLRSRDAYWRQIIATVDIDDLAYVDGFIYGEESMKPDSMELWPSGWRLFCLDAGLDPATVNGRFEALSELQRGAWQHWAKERLVDGFNDLYRFTKSYLGALKPGIQVATYMPMESLTGSGMNPAAKRWEFDIAGNYDYKGCNRIAGYMVTRHMKTLWPDRPVIWLSFGEGGYEMNPVRHNSKLPQSPISQRWYRGYADTISAWSAGAQPGWFSVWIAVAYDYQGDMSNLKGVMVVAEDMKDTELLTRAAKFSTAGLLERDASMATPATAPDATGSLEEIDDLGGLEETPDVDPQAEFKAQLAAKEAHIIRGLQVYGRYIYDLAALFRDLPTPNPKPTALVTEPRLSVWYRGTAYADVPGADLLTEFDVLQDLNLLTDVDVDRYRYIAVHDPALLQDATIEHLDRWLKEQPGILYIHRDLTAVNSREAPTAADHDGALQRDWPWEADLRITPREKDAPAVALTIGDTKLELTHGQRTSDLAVTGPRATVLASVGDKPVLLLWRHPDYRGVLLVDAMAETDISYLDALRGIIRDLAATHKLEVTLPDTALYQTAEVPDVKGMASSSYSRFARRPGAAPVGLDWFQGLPVASLQDRRDGVLASTEFTGDHVVIRGDIAVLSERPITDLKATDAAITVTAPGIVRVISARALTISPDLPEQQLGWVFESTEPGILHLPPSKNRPRHLYYFRADGPVTIR